MKGINMQKIIINTINTIKTAIDILNIDIKINNSEICYAYYLIC